MQIFVSRLPADFAAPILVVLHIPADAPTLLPQILSRKGVLPAFAAEEGRKAEPGRIYLAPPDKHLLVGRDGILRTPRGPHENRHRPAIDPLFRSAATAYRSGAIGVILSGTLDDGTAGMIAIKRMGGTAIVQDPSEAMFPSMPASVVANCDVDHVLPLEAIPGYLVESLGTEPRAPQSAAADDLEMENRTSMMDSKTMQDDDRPGKPSAFSCPDCHGVLWEIEDGDYVRYRCRVGHAFSPENMLGAQADVLEEALWTAMKTLEETARLSHRLATNERSRGHDWMAKRFEDRETEARQRADTIRKFLLRDSSEVLPVANPAQTSGATGPS